MKTVRLCSWWNVLGLILLACSGSRAEDATVRELQRELESMRKEMRSMQERIDRQQRVIDQLGARQAPAKPAPAATAAPTTSAPPAAAATPEPAAAPPPATAAREPWSPSAPIRLLGTSNAYLNLSFDALVDFGWSTTSDVTALERGDHDPLQRGFTLPNEEIFLDGAVDPYFKGVADLVFKLDENNETQVELEEAYATTTALPWNLQAKTGQFFTEFGRLNPQHPHTWDFVDQPLVIGRMFGPEGLRDPGARLSWLAPTPFYSEVFLAAQDSQGATAFSFRDTAAPRFGRAPVDRAVRSAGDLLYTPRWVSSFDLTDSQTLMTGVSAAFGPNASGNDTRTAIYGGDVYWKWKPSWQAGGFPFVGWQTEALGRRYEAGASNGLPAETLNDWGVYSQIVWGFRPRWVAGLRGDWVSGDAGAFGPDPDRSDRFRVSPDLTFFPSEFSKIRLQYNFDHGHQRGDDSSVWLQLEFLLGAHAAHKF